MISKAQYVLPEIYIEHTHTVNENKKNKNKIDDVK